MGDRLHRPGRPNRTLKKIWIDEKIPARTRDSIPVLEVFNQVAAVAGLGPDAAFLPREGERAWEITITSPKGRGE
jgi:tRNA(Ile)-lysidine synthetase-like protein